MRRIVLGVCVLLGSSLAVAAAYEVRLIGVYTFAVGFRAEPAQTFPGKPPAGYRNNNQFSLD